MASVREFGDWFGEHWDSALWLGLLGGLVLVAIHDVLQKKHAIIHNFPVVGHIRYLLESIGPELRQYLVANDKEEKPFKGPTDEIHTSPDSIPGGVGCCTFDECGSKNIIQGSP